MSDNPAHEPPKLMSWTEAEQQINRIGHRLADVIEDEANRANGLCSGIVLLALMHMLKTIIESMQEKQKTTPVNLKRLVRMLKILKHDIWPPLCHVEAEATPSHEPASSLIQ